MHIRQLTAYRARLPLKRRFAHASTTRDETENVLVRCDLADGTVGWGEGVPRDYVTGETPAGCLEQLAATPVAEQLATECAGWSEVLNLCERFTPATVRDNRRGCYGNALRCAVELSVLDAFGTLFGEPISAAAKNYPPAESVVTGIPRQYLRYSAVIDVGATRLWRKALVRRLYGFKQLKVKVGAKGDDDAARLRTIRRWVGNRVDLRIDVNGAWPVSELRERLTPLEPFGITCVEQPVSHSEIAGLAKLRGQIRTPIMLDESLTSEIDARESIDGGFCDLFNIRLSKCGGFLASLRLAALAHRSGLGFQLGCHPGETGILSAAGRHWASVVQDTRYLEGSYDRFLFRQQLTTPDITFGYGGKAPLLTRPGLGVTVDLAKLREITIAQQSFAVS
jgi:muconate cycloisomerase